MLLRGVASSLSLKPRNEIVWQASAGAGVRVTDGTKLDVSRLELRPLRAECALTAVTSGFDTVAALLSNMRHSANRQLKCEQHSRSSFGTSTGRFDGKARGCNRCQYERYTPKRNLAVSQSNQVPNNQASLVCYYLERTPSENKFQPARDVAKPANSPQYVMPPTSCRTAGSMVVEGRV